jgi:hypothetical protein
VTNRNGGRQWARQSSQLAQHLQVFIKRFLLLLNIIRLLLQQQQVVFMFRNILVQLVDHALLRRQLILRTCSHELQGAAVPEKIGVRMAAVLQYALNTQKKLKPTTIISDSGPLLALPLFLKLLVQLPQPRLSILEVLWPLSTRHQRSGSRGFLAEANALLAHAAALKKRGKPARMWSPLQ